MTLPPLPDVKLAEGKGEMPGDPLTAVAVALVQVIPWSRVGTRIKTYFSPSMTILGPEASGKTTLFHSLYNGGSLVEQLDHKRTAEITKKIGYGVDRLFKLHSMGRSEKNH